MKPAFSHKRAHSGQILAVSERRAPEFTQFSTNFSRFQGLSIDFGWKPKEMTLEERKKLEFLQKNPVNSSRFKEKAAKVAKMREKTQFSQKTPVKAKNLQEVYKKSKEIAIS